MAPVAGSAGSIVELLTLWGAKITSVFGWVKQRLPMDCYCDGHDPLRAVCLLKMAYALRAQHGRNLSLATIKRRVGARVTGREAAILLEASKLWG